LPISPRFLETYKVSVKFTLYKLCSMNGDTRCCECNLIEVVEDSLSRIEENLELEEYDTDEIKRELDGLANTLGLILSKWVPQIVYCLLLRGTMSFNELRRSLGVSSRVLSDKLRILEESGIVSRRLKDSKPPRVYYALTGFGKEIALALIPLLIKIKTNSLKLPR